MGVISKNEPKLGVFASSEESLNIPDSSDEEHSRSVNNVPNTLAPRRIRNRGPLIPMSFSIQRSHLGKKKNRRNENVNQLMTLLEDEELDEVCISDFIPVTNDAFQRLLDDEDCFEVWNNFVQSSEEVQNMVISKVGINRSSNRSITHKHGTDLSAEQAFQNIKTGLRNVLKKNHVSLGMLEFLENELVIFFSEMPHGIYISPSLSSYERLLLHGISQYHHLLSNSFDCKKKNTRLVKIVNPHKLFQSPEMLLTKYLEQKRSCSLDY